LQEMPWYGAGVPKGPRVFLRALGHLKQGTFFIL